ncbi:MAG: hypothetical protein Q7J26_03540 [Brevundimonas sp.]|uniref:hypothetical protein n=1 Tax=Brevundimonas sp. TaxID=1871086 RepID=UPI002720EB19|nr:hypothetical protein [Brevundimonas sp.]MDO9607571.1 hypothetical protein [Brevundimonas sp.]
MIRRFLLPTLVCLAALAGCERREAEPESTASAPVAPAAFQHRLEGDISGDYRPVSEPTQAWRVESLFIGQASALAAWEAGQRGTAPLILTLSGPEGTVQVAPRAYDLTDQSLHFVGETPDGQPTTLDARIDPGALATARRNLGDRTPVITGAVTVKGQRVPFSLGWWNGD